MNNCEMLGYVSTVGPILSQDPLHAQAITELLEALADVPAEYIFGIAQAFRQEFPKANSSTIL